MGPEPWSQTLTLQFTAETSQKNIEERGGRSMNQETNKFQILFVNSLGITRARKCRENAVPN